jgi:hypothetical protein
MTGKKIILQIPLLWLFLFALPANGSEFIQVAGLIDTRTTHSDGALSVDALAELARSRGFEVLVLNDHDRLAMAYGLPPFRNVIRLRKELNSINKSGAKDYMEAINRARLKFKELILIPGSESVPYYYWTGSYFKKNLTAHDHEKRILTIGMENPADYENLPIVHNGFSIRYAKQVLPSTLLFLGSLCLGLYLLTEKGFIRIAAIFIVVFSLLAILNTAPLRSSPFTPYMGNRGIAPYQQVIDYVDKKGGLTFWNYPETRSGVRPYGPIFLNTPPYPEVLEQSRRYTGFAAIYGDAITITEPGHEWDRVLQEYCLGRRARPVWGIATADFHRDGDAGEKLGNFTTVFLVEKKTQAAVLAAMRAGRMYAVRGPYPQRLILKDFSVRSSGCDARACSGEEIKIKHTAKIRIALSLKNPVEQNVKVRLIRSGKLIKAFEAKLPMDFEFEDKSHRKGEKVFYRIDARAGNAGTLVSNPIFVKFVSSQN